MTLEQINWLPDPAVELRRHPADTLILMRTKLGLLHVCKLKGCTPDGENLNAQRHPTLGIISIERMLTRGATFALL